VGAFIKKDLVSLKIENIKIQKIQDETGRIVKKVKRMTRAQKINLIKKRRAFKLKIHRAKILLFILYFFLVLSEFLFIVFLSFLKLIK